MVIVLICKVRETMDRLLERAVTDTNVSKLGVFLHIMADTLGSAGVIVSTILIKWFGWTGFDPIASLFIAILIILSVLPLIRQSSAVMMLELDDNTVAAIEGTLEEVRAIEGVYSISHARFWPCEAESIIGSLHVQVKDGVDTQLMRTNVTQLLQSHLTGLREVCVQIELQSAVKKNRFTVPQKGFFHTPVYSGVSSMNNAYMNHRPTATSAPPSTINLTLQQQQEQVPSLMPTTLAPPPSNIQQQTASSATVSPNISSVMSVLQKSTKNE
jgi:glycine cleavage system regulatory protein